MLTSLTQTAIAVLNDINTGELSTCSNRYTLCVTSLCDLLDRLESGGLIRLIVGQPRDAVLSYTLTCAAAEITLLRVLEAIGEHLNCNHKTNEEMYFHYGQTARKLDIVNQITRQYLAEINLTEL